MTQKLLTTYICDWDGRDLPEGEEGHSHVLMLDGQAVEVDYCAKHDAMFLKAQERFLNMGRVAGFAAQQAARAARAAAGGRAAARHPRRTARMRARSSDMRAWARTQGLEVSDKGRIPTAIQNRYQLAMGQQQAG